MIRLAITEAICAPSISVYGTITGWILNLEMMVSGSLCTSVVAPMMVIFGSTSTPRLVIMTPSWRTGSSHSTAALPPLTAWWISSQNKTS